jgi:hypothetical protein
MSTSKRSDAERAANVPTPAKACGHDRHVGSCACCQRAQLTRWAEQLVEASTHPRAHLEGGEAHA